MSLALVATACGNARPPASVPAATTTAPAATVFFPQQAPVNGERAVATAELIGPLVVVGDCLRVDMADSSTTLPIWPPDVTLHIEGDTIEIHNTAGQVVARVGEAVRLGGGAVPSSAGDWLSKQLRQPLPAACPGPYWLVGNEISVVDVPPAPNVPSPPAGAAPATPINPNPLLQDAQVYAADQGIPLDEAIRRLQLQDPAGALDAELTAKERDTFAGLWIQHQPEFRIVVRFTQHGEATIQPYIANGPLVDLVEVRPAQVTYAQLHADHEAVLRTLNALDQHINSQIDVVENRVEVYVIDRAQFEAVLRTAKVYLPDTVALVTVTEQSSSTPQPTVGPE